VVVNPVILSTARRDNISASRRQAQRRGKQKLARSLQREIVAGVACRLFSLALILL